jgi:hypothetical protein
MLADAPTAAELQANPVVQAALTAAWTDSLADDLALRHEEGGFIYLEVDNGAIHIRRASPGDRWGVDLTNPPILPGCFLVATYHTHPNLSTEGWQVTPSEEDRDLANDSGVPWFIVADDGVFVTGPDQRVGGLIGNPGYPI